MNKRPPSIAELRKLAQQLADELLEQDRTAPRREPWVEALEQHYDAIWQSVANKWALQGLPKDPKADLRLDVLLFFWQPRSGSRPERQQAFQIVFAAVHSLVQEMEPQNLPEVRALRDRLGMVTDQAVADWCETGLPANVKSELLARAAAAAHLDPIRIPQPAVDTAHAIRGLSMRSTVLPPQAGELCVPPQALEMLLILAAGKYGPGVAADVAETYAKIAAQYGRPYAMGWYMVVLLRELGPAKTALIGLALAVAHVIVKALLALLW